MMSSSAASLLEEPFWWVDRILPARSSDPIPSEADVVVIGSGYTGLSCATTLAQGGKSVVLLEKGRFGEGASSRAGGLVSGGVTAKSVGNVETSDADAGLALRRVKEAAEAMTFLEEIITTEQIDCDYHRSGRLNAAWSAPRLEAMRRHLDALNTYAAADAEILDAAQTAEELGSTYYPGAMRVGRAAHLNPAKLQAGLLRRALEAGVLAYDRTPAQGIEQTSAGFCVTIPGQTLRAGEVVLATNAYTAGLSPFIQRRVIPVASHMVATEPLSEALLKTVLPKDRSVSESRRVLNYFRKSADGARLVMGGRTRFYPLSPARAAQLLQRTIERIFPQLRGVSISHVWQGNVGITFDHRAHIGMADGVHYCVGCNGSGITLMPYLGHRLALKLLSNSKDPQSAFETAEMPSRRFYQGNTWFLPAVGTGMQVLDWMERPKPPRPDKAKP